MRLLWHRSSANSECGIGVVFIAAIWATTSRNAHCDRAVSPTCLPSMLHGDVFICGRTHEDLLVFAVSSTRENLLVIVFCLLKLHL